MTVTVTTNKHRRPLVSFAELPEQERRDFDYITEDEHYDPRFVYAYYSWWDAYDTQRIYRYGLEHYDGAHINVATDSPLANWHSATTTSMSTATLFRFVDDDYGDPTVVVGWAVWS
jgi:hypothetical protein